MAFDLSGNFWVSNYLTDSVFEYSSSGTFIRKLTDATLLKSTFDVALGPDGNIYATAFGNDSITKIDVVGGTYALSSFIPKPDAGRQPKYLQFDSECCVNVPEPSTLMMLFGVGLYGLMGQSRRRTK
jgi:DNA-binding beta-propeller fold protein YncE